jgi:hypothetical protein
MPLQAADILAYESNKRMRDPKRPERRPWAILRAGNAVTVGYYGRDNMHLLVDGLNKIKEGRINEIDLFGDGWNRAAGPWLMKPDFSKGAG